MSTTEQEGRPMEIGIDNFVATDPAVAPAQQIQNMLAQIARADGAGVHTFGIGEHHRADFLDSAPVTILAAAGRSPNGSSCTARSPYSAPTTPSGSSRATPRST